jgi:antitoxin (DNA-binding transcriptional repressor) of toxin-antitoxin stability system
MKEIDVSEFRANYSKIFSQVERTKKPIMIMRFGKPIARVSPHLPVPKEDRTRTMRRRMQVPAETFTPPNGKNEK